MTANREREVDMGRREYSLRTFAPGGSFREFHHPPDQHASGAHTMHKVVLRTAAIAGAIVVAACVNDAPITTTPSMANQPSLITTPNLSGIPYQPPNRTSSTLPAPCLPISQLR